MVMQCPKARVMIVEDEALIAEDLENRLQGLGYEVTGIADSAIDAFEKIEETGPDLIMMDIRIRGSVDGVTAADIIRESYRLPVVFLTAFGDSQTLERAKLAQPFGFMVKPVVTTHLPTTIEVALHKHKIEQQLNRERAWLQTTLSSIPDPTLVTDSEGRIRFINDAASALLSLNAAQVVGQTLRAIVNFTREGDTTPVGDLMRLAVVQGSILKLECECQVRGEGRSNAPMLKIPVECTVAVSRTRTEFVGSVITIRDLRPRRSMEQHTREDQKMVAVGRLSAAVAHDFNNLLTIIFGCVDEITRQLPSASPCVPALTGISDAATSAAAITKQLLSFSRPEPIRKDVIDVATVVQNQVKGVRRILEPQVKLVVRADEGCLVRAIPSQVEQLVLNLVLNARDAMPGGGVIDVHVTRASVATDSGSKNSEEFIRLTVADTGSGMSRELIDNIFEPFFTTKATGLGTGLGLSIVRAIVADLGGRISVESEVGEGTTFEVLLPDAQTVSKLGQLELIPTILIIDEQETVRNTIHQYFEDQGYNLLEAASADEALALAHLYEGKISVAITDRVDHAATITASRPDVQVLLAGSIPSGAKDTTGLPFIQNPFTKQELLIAVQKLLLEQNVA